VVIVCSILLCLLHNIGWVKLITACVRQAALFILFSCAVLCCGVQPVKCVRRTDSGRLVLILLSLLEQEFGMDVLLISVSKVIVKYRNLQICIFNMQFVYCIVAYSVYFVRVEHYYYYSIE